MTTGGLISVRQICYLALAQNKSVPFVAGGAGGGVRPGGRAAHAAAAALRRRWRWLGLRWWRWDRLARSGQAVRHGAGGRWCKAAAKQRRGERPPGCPRPLAACQRLYFKSSPPPKGALRLATLLAVRRLLALQPLRGCRSGLGAPAPVCPQGLPAAAKAGNLLSRRCRRELAHGHRQFSTGPQEEKEEKVRAVLAAATAARFPLGCGGGSMLPLLSSPLAYFYFPVFFGCWVTSPPSVWRLPVAPRPIVSNDLLTVRVLTPVARFSRRLSTTA